MSQNPIKRSVWDWVFYGSLGVLTLWLILKVTGVIQTPPLVEYGIPIASLILVLFSFFQRIVEWFAGLSNDVGVVKVDMEHMKGDMECMRGDVRRLEVRAEKVEMELVTVKTDVEKTRVDLGLLKKWFSKST